MCQRTNYFTIIEVSYSYNWKSADTFPGASWMIESAPFYYLTPSTEVAKICMYRPNSNYLGVCGPYRTC